MMMIIIIIKCWNVIVQGKNRYLFGQLKMREKNSRLSKMGVKNSGLENPWESPQCVAALIILAFQQNSSSFCCSIVYLYSHTLTWLTRRGINDEYSKNAVGVFVQPVVQLVASCIQTSTQLYNRLNNRLDECLHGTTVCTTVAAVFKRPPVTSVFCQTVYSFE